MQFYKFQKCYKTQIFALVAALTFCETDHKLYSKIKPIVCGDAAKKLRKLWLSHGLCVYIYCNSTHTHVHIHMHMVYSVIYARVLHKKTVKREYVLKGLSKSSACCKVNGSCNGSCSCIDSAKSDRQENIYIYIHIYR